MAEADFEAIISSLAQNPELMSKISSIKSSSEGKGLEEMLPEVISAIAPLMEKGEAKQEKKENDTADDTIQASQDSASLKIPFPISQIGDKINKNSALLLALKPYLSKERGDIIDSIVKMAQVTNLMKLVK
ncbi:MAG: hypothetical protein J6B29_01270 [Clostridia bacterium]|nr:hypothetical protein [Clostridia bacterium]